MNQPKTNRPSIHAFEAVALLILTALTNLHAQSAGSIAPTPARIAETKTLLLSEHPPLTSALAHRLPSFSGPGAFPSLVLAAGTIFSGKVTSITPTAATAGQTVGTVAITFHVETAFRGAIAGQELTITEWIGLWNSGQRYRVGDNVFLFLYPPSKLGLTSCVAGPLGRFAVDALGHVILSGIHVAAFGNDPRIAGKLKVSAGDFLHAVRIAAMQEGSLR